MPPRRYSRFTFSTAFTAPDGTLLLSEPDPFPFVDLPDNITHTVQDGDTLWGLAAQYYDPIPRADGLWWVIADFQSPPIVDPTIALVAGAILVIPSLRTVNEQIFNASRATQATT